MNSRVNTRRLSVTVDPDLVREAMALSGAGSQREAIETALLDMVRRHRTERMIERAGSVGLTISVEDVVADRSSE